MATGRLPWQAESPLARQSRSLLLHDPGMLGRIEILTLTGLCGTSPHLCPPAKFDGVCMGCITSVQRSRPVQDARCACK